jgi:Domain of unknown function (DUF4388)
MSDRNYYNGSNNGQYNRDENGDNGVIKDGHTLKHLFQNNGTNERNKTRPTEPLAEAPNLAYTRRGQTAPVSNPDSRLGTGKLPGSIETRVLSGKLSAFSPSSLLSLLNIQKQTGYLHLSNGATVGSIYVEKGEVFDAKLGSVTGSLALFQLFGWKIGDFGFEVGAQPPDKRTIDASLPVLQVRATLWLDNWSKYNPIIPSTSHRISIAPEPRSEVVIEPYQWPVLTKIVSQPMTIAQLAAEIDRDLMEVTKIAADLVKMGVAVVYEPNTEV